VEIRVGEKVLWKYVLCYLNNENCCLNNTIKQALTLSLSLRNTQPFLSLSNVFLLIPSSHQSKLSPIEVITVGIISYYFDQTQLHNTIWMLLVNEMWGKKKVFSQPITSLSLSLSLSLSKDLGYYFLYKRLGCCWLIKS